MYKIDFFTKRYDSATAKTVEPFYHGDYFKSSSGSNLIFGDFLTASTYGFTSSTKVVLDLKSNFYAQYLNAEWAQFFSGDILNATIGTIPIWDGQKGSDVVLGKKVPNSKTATLLAARAKSFFTNPMTVQILSDIYSTPIFNTAIKDAQARPVCTDNPQSYIPSHTLSDGSIQALPHSLPLPESVPDSLPSPKPSKAGKSSKQSKASSQVSMDEPVGAHNMIRGGSNIFH